ncbi:MAG: MmgE/PrpD family protein [Alphaproteobacteria bacterium]|nr:MmgE/PrpD family protein [Alphaproteobacteria bacterium]
MASTTEVRVYPPDALPPKEAQLAWKIAEMAAAPFAKDEEVDDMVANRIIDNAAVAMAAINRAPVANARSQALAHPRAGGATVIGLPGDQMFECEWAAWANSAAVRELDFHDSLMAVEPGHPGDNIPPILAVAQQCGRTGRDLIRGIATAYEVQLSLAQAIALNTHRIDHVGHLAPSMTAGLGALLGLAPEIVYQAIGHALHVSTATRQCRKGTISSWKAVAPAHVGKCAIEAIDRAMRGETSPAPIYEGDYGVIATLLDGPEARYAVTLADQGEPRRAILDTYTKEHSAGYHGQPIIDLAFKMRDRVNDLSKIERIDIFTKRFTHEVMGSGSLDPQKYDPDASRETLDHSAMFIFAIALEDGAWHHELSYDWERRHRPETVALWRKIKTHEDPEWNRRYDDEPDPLKKAQGARVEITFADGSKLVDEQAVANSHPLGAVPFGRAEYVEKFTTLVSGIASDGETARFLEAVTGLGSLDSGGVMGLNPVADAVALEHAARDQRGIF